MTEAKTFIDDAEKHLSSVKARLHFMEAQRLYLLDAVQEIIALPTDRKVEVAQRIAAEALVEHDRITKQYLV